jgi:pimeloyl-ACP methyl ester carboxylesterase
MFDQRAFVERVERANTAEFARLLASPTFEEEEALRAYFGDDCYHRLHVAALPVALPEVGRGLSDWLGRRDQPASRLKGNVVLLPGIMGSELSAIDTAQVQGSRIWLNLLRIALGQLDRLSLGPGGRDAGFDVQATGILKSYYGIALLTLARRWKAQAFWYDWRQNLDQAADQLRVEIDRWFGHDSPVHLVAHSMGGLVCRTFIKRHPDRWKTMWDAEGNGERGGRLVMLGTPNYGSYVILQAACGMAATVRKLAIVDLRHDISYITRILNTFVGSFQMLPSPERDRTAEALYDAKTYGDLNISQSLLDFARAHHRFLSDVIDGERMVYVAGSNQPTLAGLSDPVRLRDPTAYLGTMQGDGSVPHLLGLLKGVRAYFIEEEHSALTGNAKVLAALDDLMMKGTTDSLAGGEVTRGKPRVKNPEPWAMVGMAASEREAAELSRVQELSHQIRRRLQPTVRGNEESATITEIEAQRVSRSESQLRDLITSSFLSSGRSNAARTEAVERIRPMIVVRLFQGKIEDVDSLPELIDERNGEPLPVDSVAVGHYLGVRPQSGELALDKAVSRAILGTHDELSPAELVLTQYTDRGLLRGDLGTTFFLPMNGQTQRLLAVAGMGPVGGCGTPELTILVRELCWALSRYGKKHLATLLIASGNGNLSVRQCVEAWVRGLKRALDETYREKRGLNLRCVTFVEFDPLKVGVIQEAILDVIRLQSEEIQVVFDPLNEDQLHELEHKGLEMQAQALERQIQQRREEHEQRRERRIDQRTTDLEPTRFTVGMTPDPDNASRVIYRFGALTATASIPERAIMLNRVLVEKANDELADETDLDAQRERGQFLGRLLIPQDLGPQLSSTAPMILQVDAATARIHWEMVSQPDPILREDDSSRTTDVSAFLGTYRGLTRQLRTTFARTPQPARNHQAIPSVLVVADPARDHPLAGAAEEGLAVSTLFESFNTIAERAGWPQRFKVTRLIGPIEATPTRVLRELTVRRYELLHYAGHCFFDPKHPAQSGWIFSDGVVISANELERIDRVPSFIMSNACESGITPDRSGERSAAMVPSFAEAFFAQGVSNYVGTAWPVDDTAARIFAITLYASLIGLSIGPDGQLDGIDPKNGGRLTPSPMHLAMLRARLAIANTSNGRGTWGAYQHYGNPYYRILPTRETS